ncbi:hypothetical protein HD597_001014 [Nonomuraea thailandensis]|uniref:Uncharacterized protein n=1 Tax=Nonomuraea thailandensis TaxID=1188745 RepID=A0A9X2JZA0_9ACTN|nr:hypothetical protein [Nonomuraea thailandensis]
MPRRVRIDGPTIRGRGLRFAGIPARAWGPVRLEGEDPICGSSRHRVRAMRARMPPFRRPRGGASGGRGGATAMTPWRVAGPATRAGCEGHEAEGVRARGGERGHGGPLLRRATAAPWGDGAISTLGSAAGATFESVPPPRGRAASARWRRTVVRGRESVVPREAAVLGRAPSRFGLAPSRFGPVPALFGPVLTPLAVVVPPLEMTASPSGGGAPRLESWRSSGGGASSAGDVPPGAHGSPTAQRSPAGRLFRARRLPAGSQLSHGRRLALDGQVCPLSQASPGSRMSPGGRASSGGGTLLRRRPLLQVGEVPGGAPLLCG